MKTLPNVHPGAVLLEEFLTPLGISQNALARAAGVPRRRINEIVLGKRSVTADTAVRLAAALGTSERFWLGLQADYESGRSAPRTWQGDPAHRAHRGMSAISERCGVLGAMDTMYRRGKIQEESLYYEHKKHDGSLPLIGVNTFLPKDHGGDIVTEIELIRSTEGEKGQQISNARRSRPGEILIAPKDCAAYSPPRAKEERICQPDGGGEDAFVGADQSCPLRCGLGIPAKHVRFGADRGSA